MFEEFDHFFTDSIAYKAYVDGVFLEAYSKKEQHRIDKFLKENKFIEDPSKTTAEEKRKGYRRGTIETDITDKDGKKKRVPFELNPSKRMNASVAQKTTKDNNDEYDLNNYTVSISKKVASRKPVISNFILKHEEGHLALFLDKDGKYTVELDKLNSILTRSLHKMLTTKDILSAHDENIDEFFADKYGDEHNKYKSRSKYQMSESEGDLHIDIATKNAATGLLTLTSSDTFMRSYMATELRNLNNASKKLLAEEMVPNFRRNRLNDNKRKRSSIEFSTKMLNSYNSLLKDVYDDIDDAKWSIKDDKNKLQKLKKGLDDIDRVYKDLASDLNDDLIHFKNKGRELSKSERKKLVKAMLFKAERSAFETKIDSGLYGNLNDTLNIIHRSNEIKQRINYYNEKIDTSIKEIQTFKDEIKDAKNDIEKLNKEIEANNKLILESINNPAEFVKTLDSFKDAYDCAKSRNEKLVKQRKPNDISTMVRILMLLPDQERTAIVNKINAFMRSVKQYYQETFDINTFDDVIQESYTNRSNHVYTNYEIEKVNDYPFDVVYFGSPDKQMNPMSIDGPLFVTPYPGIASIFAVRPQHTASYGVLPGYGYTNRDYEEFDTSLKDTLLQQPLSEVHMTIQTSVPMNIPDKTEQRSGFIHAIRLTPELKDHIYHSRKMHPIFEVCLDNIDSVPFESIEPIDVTLHVSGGLLRERSQLSTRGWRITHNGVGIYEALKKAMYETTQSTNIWSTFLGTPACGWLPKPPTYKSGDTSYFTEIGYKKFMSMTFPVVIEYINQSEIDVEEVMIPCDTITYADEYQFVANEISTVTENKLTTTERHGLQPEDFGVPELRKFPLTNAKGEPDEAHINAAVKMFPNCPFKYRKQLALNILKFADKLNMDTSGWKSLAKYKE